MKHIFTFITVLIALFLSFGCMTKSTTKIIDGKSEVIIKEEPRITTHSYLLSQDPYIEEGVLKCKIFDEEVKYSTIKRTKVTPKVEQTIEWKERTNAYGYITGTFILYPVCSSVMFGIPFVYDICATLTYPIHKNENEVMRFCISACFSMGEDFGKNHEVSGSRKVVSSKNLEPETKNLADETKSIANKYWIKDISVKAEYDDKLLLNNTAGTTSSVTNGEGLVSFQLSAKDGFFFSEQEACKKILEELNEHYYVENMENILKDTAITSDVKSTFVLSTKNDKRGGSVSLFTKKQSLKEQIDSQIRQLLQEHVSRKFAPRTISIEVRDIDSQAMLDDVRFELKPVDIITEQTVIAEQKKFLGLYLRHPADYDNYLLEPAPMIAALPAKIEFVSNLQCDINVPVKYDVIVTHPDYSYVKGELIFNDQSLKKTIHMSKLGGKSDENPAAGTKGSGKN